MTILVAVLPRLASVAALSLLAGCAVGPDFTPPPAPTAKGYTSEPLTAETASAPVSGGEAQHLDAGNDIPEQWWTLFHSAPLNSMIAQALKANPDLQAAQAALRVAQENISAQEGFFFPTIQAGFNGQRAKATTIGSQSSPTDTPPVTNLYTGQLAISYAPDVWGANWRQVESLDAQAESQRFQLVATQLTLTSNVVVAVIQEASLRGQMAATEEVVSIERQMLSLLEKQLAFGQVARLDVEAQKSALAQAEQTLPPLRKQLALQRDALTALLGRLPDEEPSEKFDLDSLQLPQNLPLSLPAKLVEQRPDIRQAAANLQVSSAQIGVAVANRLPVINLTANMGSSASLLSGKDNGYDTPKVGLFTPGTGFWTLAGSLTQPIFDGFTLLHRERAARAAYDQAEAQYRSTVITAFQNVADTLRALQTDADGLKASVAADLAATESLKITRRQLELGQVAYVALLTAEQAALQTRIALVQARANRLADTAALFQSLGGGWWSRDHVVEN